MSSIYVPLFSYRDGERRVLLVSCGVVTPRDENLELL